MTKVSVVIPIYNAEKYLKECLDSVVGQSLREIEIICVNDGSSDGSAVILQEYAKSDERVRIFEQKNQGASSARNHGIRNACGEYLYFMDSDDILRKDALEKLFACAEENRLDILYFDGESIFETEELREEQKNYETYYIRTGDYSHVTSGPELFRQMVMADEYRVSPCLQFLRRSFCEEKNLRFYEGIVGEDNIFTCEAILAAKRVSHIKDRLFYRRVRKNSIMTSDGGFESVRGFFVGFLEIEKIFCKNTLQPQEQEALAKVLDQRLRVARKKYHQLDEEAQNGFLFMELKEKTMFQLMVKEYEDALFQQEKLKKKYKQVCQDKTDRGIEIHELRREKQDRGRQIQELKKEISHQKKQLAQQQKTIEQQNAKLTEVQARLSAIEQSVIYRILRAVTRSFRH